ncbi:MAG: FHA domain-containing protein [Planctomycetes bacterium]|nr:FHA domain-containing protein [Planctomycetota bacterium]
MAYKLTVVLSGRTLSRHELSDDDERVRMGRSPDCEVTIDNLGVSRVHCEIVQKPGYFQLRDLQSGNGTFVNGERVESYNLNQGDVISLGKFTIRFEAEDLPDPSEESGDHMPLMVEGSMTLAMDAATLAKKHKQQATKNRGYFALSTGSEIVLDKAVFSVGKDSEADLELKGFFCPRVVAIVIREESGFRLLDVTNGGRSLKVNGRFKRDSWLKEGDELEVRGTTMVFHRGVPVGH